MNELVNDDIKLSKLEINTGFINGLPKKWLSFCQTLRNTNHVKESELASLYGKLKYEENLTDIIYETEKKKSLVSATPLSTAFIFTSIIQDIQDSPDDGEDTRSSQDSSASASKSSMVKNKGLIAKAYEWDEEEVSSDNNEMTEVKVLMALANDENVVVGKKSARNGEWVKISMRKCISEQIPTQKNRILGTDQLTEDPSSSRQKELILVKSSADDTKVSIPATKYESANESSVCNTPLPLLEKLVGVEPVSTPKTIKSILKSKSTFKADTLKGITINEPSLAPAKVNNKVSASKTNSAHVGKLKNVKIEDDLPLAICDRTDHRTCDHAEYMSSINISLHLKGQGGSSTRSKTPRPSKHFFPPCIHCWFSDPLSDDYVNYPICDICKSYDHDTHGHNRVISLKRGIKPRNPQHVIKSCETCGSTIYTTSDHNDIEWFRRGEALQAKKAEAHKSIKTKSSNAGRSKTLIKRWVSKQN
ncbi:hypothetical protein Tco_1104485 [Tanacetum coccineum]